MSARPGYKPYEPLHTLKRWGPSIWTVDGPEIGFGFAGLTIPCPTRMTVIRLGDGALWVHSPIAFSSELAEALQTLGPLTHIVAPNMHHYVHLTTWAQFYPDAQVYALEALARKIDLVEWSDVLGEQTPWTREIATVHFDAGDFQECAFFHHESKTVIFTDLMQRFEADRIANPLIRLVLSLGGATGPGGQPSIDMRFALKKHRHAMRRGLRDLERLAPERIILSHGECLGSNTACEIERAFSYL